MKYYCYKGINHFKTNISKILFEEHKKEYINIHTIQASNFKIKNEKRKKITKSLEITKNKSMKDFNPPKKERIKRINHNKSFEIIKPIGDLKLISLFNKKKRSIKNKNQKNDEQSVKSDKIRKIKSIIDYQAEILKTNENFLHNIAPSNTNDNKINAKKRK